MTSRRPPEQSLPHGLGSQVRGSRFRCGDRGGGFKLQLHNFLGDFGSCTQSVTCSSVLGGLLVLTRPYQTQTGDAWEALGVTGCFTCRCSGSWPPASRVAENFTNCNSNATMNHNRITHWHDTMKLNNHITT